MDTHDSIGHVQGAIAFADVHPSPARCPRRRPGWASKLTASRALEEYKAHLSVLGKEDPSLLLAHAYTQHLAVAAGGQIIRRLARKHMGLPGDAGTAAFEYEVGATAPCGRRELPC